MTQQAARPSPALQRGLNGAYLYTDQAVVNLARVGQKATEELALNAQARYAIVTGASEEAVRIVEEIETLMIRICRSQSGLSGPDPDANYRLDDRFVSAEEPIYVIGNSSVLGAVEFGTPAYLTVLEGRCSIRRTLAGLNELAARESATTLTEAQAVTEVWSSVRELARKAMAPEGEDGVVLDASVLMLVGGLILRAGRDSLVGDPVAAPRRLGVLTTAEAMMSPKVTRLASFASSMRPEESVPAIPIRGAALEELQDAIDSLRNLAEAARGTGGNELQLDAIVKASRPTMVRAWKQIGIRMLNGPVEGEEIGKWDVELGYLDTHKVAYLVRVNTAPSWAPTRPAPAVARPQG